MHTKHGYAFEQLEASLSVPGIGDRSPMKTKISTVAPLLIAIGIFFLMVYSNARGIRHNINLLNRAVGAPIPPDKWTRGWPIEYVQSSRVALRNERIVLIRGRFGTTQRWIVSPSTEDAIPTIVLALNVVLGTTFAFAAFLLLRRLFRRFQWDMQLSIRSLLLLTAMIAAAFALRQDIAIAIRLFERWDGVPDVGRILTPFSVFAACVTVFVWLTMRLRGRGA